MAGFGPEEFVGRSGRRLVIRHCEAGDVDAFVAFQVQVAAETTHTNQMTGRPPERDKVDANWRGALENELSLRLGVFEGGRMVANLGFHPEGEGRHPWVRHLGRFGMMVLREHWGEGLGRRLLEIMEGHARARGITRIEALVRVENERGLKLYRRMGYRIEGTRRRAARIDGRYQDEFFIAKLLDAPPAWRPPALETDRLRLRPLELRDAPAIFEYARNPAVSRYTLWEPHSSVKDSEGYVLDYAFSHYADREPEPWGITLKAGAAGLGDDAVIGTVGLFWVSEAAKAMELAYALGEPHWGLGLAVEASRAAIDYSVRELGAKRIQARCKVENAASARVMEKLGMRHEGTHRAAVFHRNRHWDMHIYAVLKGE